MSTDRPSRRILPLLGYFLLLACATAALWFAVVVIVPNGEAGQMSYHDPLPEFAAFAIQIYRAVFNSITLFSLVGFLFFIIALVGKGPARLISVCRAALCFLACFVTLLALFFLCSGGTALVIAMRRQDTEIHFYKRTLDQFALLQAAEGRYQKLHEAFEKSRYAKMVEVQSVSEFSNDDAKIRISALLDTLAHTTNPVEKKQLLATLYLFRDRVPAGYSETHDIPRYAAEAGAPASKSPAETFEWIAANLHKDGWDPLPLFKMTR